MDWLQSQVLQPLMQTLVAALVAVAIAALKKYLDSKGLQIEAQEYYKLRQIATSAVLQSEEHVEQLATDAVITNKAAAKMEHAVNVIQAQAPEVSAVKATALAQEAVAKLGLGASAKAAAVNNVALP